MEQKSKSSGFTLIETLLYIALFTIVIGGGMVATYNIIQATSAGNNHTILQEEANFLFRKIDWALTGAASITVTADTLTAVKPSLASNQNRVVFDSADFTVGGVTHKGVRLQRFDDTSGVLFSSNELNSSDFIVTNLQFTSLSGTPHGVTSGFTLITVSSGRAASQDFSTTKYLRQ